MRAASEMSALPQSVKDSMLKKSAEFIFCAPQQCAANSIKHEFNGKFVMPTGAQGLPQLQPLAYSTPDR